MVKSNWSNDWKVGIRVWIERRGQAILGDGRAELLAAIDRWHSITAAAKAAGMSYRRAWNLIQEVNSAAGQPLVEAAVGGKQGGGARLTRRGQFALQVYERLRSAMQANAVDVLRRSLAPNDEALPCVHLAAAISLQEVLSQLLAEYALRNPAVVVRAVYGASNELADHLLSGAPGDLFISADTAQIDRLRTAKRLVAGSRKTVAINGLVAIGKRACDVQNLAGLTSKKIGRVVLADPACPLGRYSKLYLEAVGIYEDLLPKVVHVDNSRAVISALDSSAADVGLAFSSDADRSNDLRILFRASPSQVAPQYVAGLIRGSRQQSESRALLEFIASDDAAPYFRRCGLQPA